jgi:hypothetical protein
VAACPRGEEDKEVGDQIGVEDLIKTILYHIEIPKRDLSK